MGRILALQGGMAVGKTTVARFLAEQGVPVFPEDISRPAARCRALGLDKRTREGYSETQRLFIANEIERWQAAARHPLAVLDLGPQEIEFYTLHYPASIGQDWPVAEDLAPELAALRRCRVDRTLFLDASPAVLEARCRADATRDRGFFAHSTRCLLPAFEWTNVRGFSESDMAYLDTFIHNNAPLIMRLAREVSKSYA